MEALMRAQCSRDLQEAVEGVGDVDWIRAAGMIGQRHGPALALWRLVELRDPHALKPALAGAVGVAVRMQIGRPAHVATSVLAYLTDTCCRPCKGRGYRAQPGTPYLTAEQCAKCGGTGRRAPRWSGAAVALNEKLQGMQREAAVALARKMA